MCTRDKEEFSSCSISESILILFGKSTLRAYAFLGIDRIHSTVLGEMNTQLVTCLHQGNFSGSIEIEIETRKASPIFCITEKREIKEGEHREKEVLTQELVLSTRRKVEWFKGTFESIYEGLIELKYISDPRVITRCLLRSEGYYPASLPETHALPIRKEGTRKTADTLLEIVHSGQGILNINPIVDRLLRTFTTEKLDLIVIFEPIDLSEIHQPDQPLLDFLGERFREACRTGAWNSRLYLRPIKLDTSVDRLTMASLMSRVETCLSDYVSEVKSKGKKSSGDRIVRVTNVSEQSRAKKELLLREIDGLGEVLTSTELSCFLYPYDLGSRRTYRLLSTPLKVPSQEDLQYHKGEGVPIGLVRDCMERPIGIFEIGTNELKRHLCILGVTGSGKTTTGIILALELSKLKVPVVILDRNGEYTKTLSRFSHLAETLLPGRDLVLSPFESEEALEPGEQIEDWIDAIADYIEVGWDEPLSPSQNRTLRLALEECRGKKGSFTISNLLDELRNPGERAKGIKWWKESSESIISRLEIFTSGRCREIFDVDRSRLDLAPIFKPFITIIDLSFFSDDRPKNLFSQLFSRKLGRYLRDMGETIDLRLVYLIDEAQHIAPQRFSSELASRMGIVERFAVEFRKYGVGLVTIVTRPTMISKNILANSNTIINHCLFYEDDVKRMKETLGLTGDDELSSRCVEQCLRTLEPGGAIVRYGSCESPFLVKIGTSEHTELLMDMRSRKDY